MDSEIRLCGRIVFRLPANKLFRKKKPLKNISALKIFTDINITNENSFQNYINSKNLYYSNYLWNEVIANGYSYLISTDIMIENIFCANKKQELKLIMFHVGKLNCDTVRTIIKNNFGDERLLWFIKKFKIPREIVFDVMSYIQVPRYHVLPLMRVYEEIKKIEKYYDSLIDDIIND
jgi:hypothetical protein